VGSEFQGLVSLLAGGRMAVAASHDLLTKKAILNAVPPQTQWLVIRGVFHTNSPGSVPAMEHLLLFVDCLGIVLSEESYTECLVQMLGAYSWLGSKGARGTRSLSRVFIHPSCTTLAGRLLQEAQISCNAVTTGFALSKTASLSQCNDETADVSQE